MFTLATLTIMAVVIIMAAIASKVKLHTKPNYRLPTLGTSWRPISFVSLGNPAL